MQCISITFRTRSVVRSIGRIVVCRYVARCFSLRCIIRTVAAAICRTSGGRCGNGVVGWGGRYSEDNVDVGWCDMQWFSFAFDYLDFDVDAVQLVGDRLQGREIIGSVLKRHNLFRVVFDLNNTPL